VADERSVDVAQPTDRTAPDQTVDGLIDEALDATRILPPYQRCTELNKQLRAAIGDLYPAVQEHAARQSERSRDWYRIHGALEETDDVLAAGLGSGLLSAALHLAALGRQCRTLKAIADET
jgi:hypothetical protein